MPSISCYVKSDVCPRRNKLSLC